VFLFSLLLAYFGVPPELRGQVIVIGIAGALLLCAVAIAGGLALIEAVEAVVYVFGVLLLYVAYRAFRGAPEQSDPAENAVLRLVRRTVPITDDFRDRRLLVREGGGLYGTPLLLVVVAIIAADIAFAVDSIPAAFAVTRDPVVIWTANAFAVLGLGSILAIVEILVRRFRYLDETIALILAFVGIKILAADLVHIGDLGSLAVIVVLLAGGIVASLVADRVDAAPRRGGDETAAALPERTHVDYAGGFPDLTGRGGRHRCVRARSSSVVSSAVGTASSRASGIGSPLSIDSPYVPAVRRSSARSTAASWARRSSSRPPSSSSW
jgi:tellurite resistance protein TerC